MVRLVAALVGGSLVAIGALLPWISGTVVLAGTITRSGMDGGDGVFALVAGLVIALVALTGLAASGWIDLARLLAAVGGVAAIGLGIVELNAMNERIAGLDSTYGTASVGIGIYAILVGGGVALVGGLIATGPPMRAAVVPEPEPAAARQASWEASGDVTSLGSWLVQASDMPGVPAGAEVSMEVDGSNLLIWAGDVAVPVRRRGLAHAWTSDGLVLADGRERRATLHALRNADAANFEAAFAAP